MTIALLLLDLFLFFVLFWPFIEHSQYFREKSGSLSLKPDSVTYSPVQCVLLVVSPDPTGLKDRQKMHSRLWLLGLDYSPAVSLHDV